MTSRGANNKRPVVWRIEEMSFKATFTLHKALSSVLPSFPLSLDGLWNKREKIVPINGSDDGEEDEETIACHDTGEDHDFYLQGILGEKEGMKISRLFAIDDPSCLTDVLILFQTWSGPTGRSWLWIHRMRVIGIKSVVSVDSSDLCLWVIEGSSLLLKTFSRKIVRSSKTLKTEEMDETKEGGWGITLMIMVTWKCDACGKSRRSSSDGSESRTCWILQSFSFWCHPSNVGRGEKKWMKIWLEIRHFPSWSSWKMRSRLMHHIISANAAMEISSIVRPKHPSSSLGFLPRWFPSSLVWKKDGSHSIILIILARAGGGGGNQRWTQERKPKKKKMSQIQGNSSESGWWVNEWFQDGSEYRRISFVWWSRMSKSFISLLNYGPFLLWSWSNATFPVTWLSLNHRVSILVISIMDWCSFTFQRVVFMAMSVR